MSYQNGNSFLSNFLTPFIDTILSVRKKKDVDVYCVIAVTSHSEQCKNVSCFLQCKSLRVQKCLVCVTPPSPRDQVLSYN